MSASSAPASAAVASTGWLADFIGQTFAITAVEVRKLVRDPTEMVTRAVQPALLEVQRDLEEAAETLGAHRLYVFRRIILPTVLPALLTGFTLAFARAPW